MNQLEDCDSVFAEKNRELGLCQMLFNEIGEIQGGDVDENTTANDNEEITDEWCADDPGLCEGESEDELCDDEGCYDDYDDSVGMLDDDMGVPTASTCQGSTFGEQLLCAFLNALTTLVQEAFSSN